MGLAPTWPTPSGRVRTRSTKPLYYGMSLIWLVGSTGRPTDGSCHIDPPLVGSSKIVVNVAWAPFTFSSIECNWIHSLYCFPYKTSLVQTKYIVHIKENAFVSNIIKLAKHHNYSHMLTLSGAPISNYIHYFLWDVTIHFYTNFNGAFVKPLFKLGIGWVITSHCLVDRNYISMP